MQENIRKKLDRLQDQALTFVSYGTSPFTLLILEKGASEVLQDLEKLNNGKDQLPEMMVGIFRRLDFRQADRVDYYSLSREVLNLDEDQQHRAIRHLSEMNGELSDWAEGKLAILEGFVFRIMQQQSLDVAAIQNAQIVKFNLLLPKSSPIELASGFWILGHTHT
ncbi:hypothetical protein ACQKCH_03950 [Nubsella zeaxanthinifaciens]|uniref:hypothetical protein n=1 Tax=Nubsella zeaxanthinifaciens TaxID=392412 RepID=UPI003D06885C